MSDSQETNWDPISTLGRVMPPSNFVQLKSDANIPQMGIVFCS